MLEIPGCKLRWTPEIELGYFPSYPCVAMAGKTIFASCRLFAPPGDPAMRVWQSEDGVL